MSNTYFAIRNQSGCEFFENATSTSLCKMGFRFFIEKSFLCLTIDVPQTIHFIAFLGAIDYYAPAFD